LINKSTRVLVLLSIFSFSLFSQETNPEEDTQQISLYEKTLYSDINTASYYEVLSWCRELGLEETGNLETLKKLLYQHYGIDLNSQVITDSKDLTIVKIVSADSTEYYTIDEVDEEYVRISGRVKLIVKEPVNNITHTIEADTILFNKTINTMTASGDILYVKEENGKEEEYSGDNFTFNVESWKGVILKGDFKKTQEVDGTDLEFIFSGESILSGEGDIVVLNDGSISSCDEEEKHYQIKAKKIWILGPDEWAIMSGFLYVGNVPLLYIPFYHRPGNDMFFNPAIGSATREGYFIQTTTYLLGRKEISDGDDSFFINVADTDETYKLVREGLFLFKESGEPEEESSDYIKYKLDYYSKLGGYTGLEGSLKKWGFMKSFNFDIGLAVSKSISDDDSYYTNYFSENDYEAEWNSSYLLGLYLPFRWGLTFNFSFSTFKVDFEYISDPWFISDYDSREENFDWVNYVLSQTTSEDDVDTSSTSSFDWSLSGSLSIPNEWAGDYINNLSLSSIKAEIDWSSKDNEDASSSYNPDREFFYPDSITLPQTTLSLSGVLLNLSTNDSDSSTGTSQSDKGNLRSPWNSGGTKSNSDSISGQDSTFGKSEFWDDIDIDDDVELFSTQIDYKLSGYFNFVHETDSDEWDNPSEVDFEVYQSTFTNNNTLKLNYVFNYWDSMFSLSGTNSFSANYLKYINNVDSDDETKENEYQELDWSNDLNFKILPLKNVLYLDKSYLSYDLDATLYQREYDSSAETFEDYWISWDDDYISTHKASADIDFNLSFFNASLLFSTTLPPTDVEQSIGPSVSLNFFNWTNSADLEVIYSDGEWSLDPFSYSSTYTPTDKITLSESLTYSFEEETLTSSISKLKLWDFTATFNMAYTTDYEWDKDASELVDNGEAFVPSSLALAYGIDYTTPSFWKSRVNMEFDIDTNLNMNLQQYNLSELNFDFVYKLHIFEFLDLNITLSTTNDHMYLYFSSLRDYYGIEDDYNFFTDLAKSFNIFSTDQQDRYDSFFNMNSIEIEFIHKLHDWDLEFSYLGKPEIDDDTYETSWDSTVTILVRWNPIEKIKIQVDKEDDEWNADTEFD
jgi:hypothetical protein